MRTASIGDTITGRCVTTNIDYTGEVVAIYRPRPGSGYTMPRYRLCRTGQFYSCGSAIEPVVTNLAVERQAAPPGCQ